MRNSLFGKYFAICSSMMLLCIVTLGTVLTVGAAQYFTMDKYELLGKNASHAAQLTGGRLIKASNQYIISHDIVSGYRILSEAIGADIFLVDLSGKTILCTHEDPCIHTTYLIPSHIMQAASKGQFREMGRLGGIYTDESYFTVSAPVLSKDGDVAGVVFASSSAKSLTVFLLLVLRVFGFSSLFFMLAALVIMYFVTKRLVSPLTDMVKATHSFSSGDFTIRVPVEGYDEIAQLAISFNNMASSLAMLESVRRSFMANVSHELKTPMTTIAGFIDGMLDGTIPPEKQKYYLQTVSNEVKRLSRVVLSMLNIARMEAGELSMQPVVVDINDIICRTVFTFERQIEEKRLEVRGLDGDKMLVEADEDLIHQVVYNLVENAVKFASPGGYIEASYAAEGGIVYIGIKNSGDGISKDEISRVFDRFYKSDKSRSLDKNGVGLGLHIVRSIMNLHKGEVIVRSMDGEYCEFVFTLRAAGQKGRKQLAEKQNKP